MKKKTPPALRIKLTGKCNRSCFFCHQEGDMETIGDISADPYFFEVVQQLMEKTGCERIMLTGGEPTLHPQLLEIVTGLKQFATEISITSNGIRVLTTQEWLALKNAGLDKLIISIHDVTSENLLKLETIKKSASWAQNALKSQHVNIQNALSSGLYVRLNHVAHGDYEKTLSSVEHLLALQQNGQPEVRLLNNLYNLEQSQKVIDQVVSALQAKPTGEYYRAGTSNLTHTYSINDNKNLSVKLSFPYYLSGLCDLCTQKDQCHEGFYGLRFERRGDEYFIRLCIYRQDSNVLMPWHQFLSSTLVEKMRNHIDA